MKTFKTLVTEISTDLASRYLKKAKKDHDSADRKLYVNKAKLKKGEAEKLADKRNRRSVGIQMARDKLGTGPNPGEPRVKAK